MHWTGLFLCVYNHLISIIFMHWTGLFLCVSLGRQMLLGGGNVARGKQCCSGKVKLARGKQNLLWGSKFARGRQCCSGEAMLLGGMESCSEEVVDKKALSKHFLFDIDLEYCYNKYYFVYISPYLSRI